MKIIGQKGSITKGDNRIVSSTFADWTAIREGSFIKFSKDNHFYTIARVEKRNYIKAFTVEKNNLIKINDYTGINICDDDTLTISYKEYEASLVTKVINSGNNYKVGDILTLEGGMTTLNITDNLSNPAQVTVTQVENGSIKEVQIKNKGQYIIAPATFVNGLGGNGHGASFEVLYSLIDNRQILEKDVEHVSFQDSQTFIKLIYPIPEGIKEGKVSLQKFEIILSSNYEGESKVDETFDIMRDFTPFLGLPLLSKNSFDQIALTNIALMKIDAKLKELSER